VIYDRKVMFGVVASAVKVRAGQSSSYEAIAATIVNVYFWLNEMESHCGYVWEWMGSWAWMWMLTLERSTGLDPRAFSVMISCLLVFH